MKVLALSSSRSGNSGYLETAIPFINELFEAGLPDFVFVPFASTGSYDEYYQKVKEGLSKIPMAIQLADDKNAYDLIQHAEGIMVGGGNTFKLLHDLYELDLIKLIQKKVRQGTPYIGWSAGANILGASIGTTNDMPIIQPRSFRSLNIFPFQINPHYYNQHIPGFNGETRDQRLQEFLALNPTSTIVALPEGSALVCHGESIVYYGRQKGVRFYYEGSVQRDDFENEKMLRI